MLDTQSPFLNQSQPNAVGLTEGKLRSAIIAIGLAPGARLSEIELCKVYGQGRGIVRAALGNLAHAGFVLSQPRSGWKVSPISAAGLREVIMARSRLESLLADVLLSDGELARIRTIADMQAALWSAPQAVSSEHAALQRVYDRQIRDILVAKLRAPLIAEWLGNLFDKSERYLTYFERSAGRSAPPFDWLPFIEAKTRTNSDDAALVLSKGCEAFARFAQASLLESDLIAPDAAKDPSKSPGKKPAILQKSSHRRERLSKRTI